MSVGFSIVFVGILTAGTNFEETIVAGVAGVLSQFIAATFLVALRSTQRQSTAYAQTRVELPLRDVRAAADAHSIALGLELLNDISGRFRDRHPAPRRKSRPELLGSKQGRRRGQPAALSAALRSSCFANAPASSSYERILKA
jgi:hypothetical protein